MASTKNDVGGGYPWTPSRPRRSLPPLCSSRRWRASSLASRSPSSRSRSASSRGTCSGSRAPRGSTSSASFAGILLTFLAGAEVDPQLLRARFRESVLLGGLSFAVPFAAAGLFAYFVAGWDLRQSEIAGVALSTTSLAVVYAVLVETGLTRTEIGKLIMAATFVTDLGTATALSVLFLQPSPFLIVFMAASVAVVAVMLAL